MGLLKKGDSGPAILELQKALGRNGYVLVADGVFGSKTMAAVIDFQTKHSLDSDGIVGPKTQEALAHGITVVPSKGLLLDGSEYSDLYKTISIRDGWLRLANATAAQVLGGKPRYDWVASRTGVPWHVIGCIHSLEGSCNFKTHLHNGDSLMARTKHVPAGRPIAGSPPFTWEESALDALAYDGLKGPMATLGIQFRAMEKFNGMGYRGHGINTPYLWSGSNHYFKGKYVSDGHWDSSAVSEQVGAAVIIKVLQDKGAL